MRTPSLRLRSPSPRPHGVPGAGGLQNPESFVAYMPGVNSGAETSISGSIGRAKEVLVDGASITIPESGGVVFNFQSALQFNEFKLVTGNYSAEYGFVMILNS